MKQLIFWVSILTNVLVILGAIFSVLVPEKRLWPPPGKDSWQFWITWTSVYTGMLTIPILGLLDQKTLFLPTFNSTFIGVMFILAGLLFGLWSVRTLSINQSLGLRGKLVTEGPYRYSRNPQYLGFILIYVGIILVTGSYLIFITSGLVILGFLVAPFSEEPWLLEKYGEPYKNYMKKVRRLI